MIIIHIFFAQNCIQRYMHQMSMLFVYHYELIWLTGHTDNFEHAFNNTSNEPGSIALAVLDGYFAYKGWYVFT